MGVVVIREENPFAEFLKGIQPIGEAYFNRQAERGRANLLNDINNYAGAKPNVMQASQLSDQFSQGYAPSQATGVTPQGLMDMKNNEALFSQFMQGSGATYPMQEAQQQFVANQAAEKARLIKQGADYFGAQGTQQLLTDAENKQRLQNFTADPNMSYQDLVRAALSYSTNSNDPKGVLSAIDMLKPNAGLHSVNLGGKTGLITHDPTGNSQGGINLVDNTLSPGQVQQGQQYNSQREYDWKKYTTGLNHETNERQKDRDFKTSQDKAYLNAKVGAAKQVISSHQNWLKTTGGKEEESPYYADAQGAMVYLSSVYGAPGSAPTASQSANGQGPQMSPIAKQLESAQFEKAVSSLVADAQKQGHNLSRQQAIELLRENYGITEKPITSNGGENIDYPTW